MSLYTFMKKILLTTFCCYISVFVFAQNAPQTTSVKGILIDSAINKPLGYATVAITDAVTNLPVKSTLTKDDGSFEITRLAPKTYKLSFIYVGYKTKAINIAATTDINTGKMLLSPASNQLKEVSVTAARPLMKQEVDRISYDVQADPESKQLTALDMIRKVPLLSVDGTDNIKLRGSGNYKILLNGKESALMSSNPSDILKAMPGSNIVKIEVITTPPAKYDAEGLAGIINIITVKKADQGYNGSINANYNSVFGYRTNLNATVKQGKFGFNGYGGYGQRPRRDAEFFNQTDFFNTQSTLIQNGTQSNKGINKYGSAELSFEADSLNLLTGTFNIYNGNNNSVNNQNTMQRDSDGVVTNSNILNNGARDWNRYDVGINYQLGFKNNKDQLLTASYKYSNFTNNQFNDIIGANAPSYRQYNSSGSKEHTTQLDYIQPFKVITIEAGGKLIDRNNFSNFHSDALVGNQYLTDTAQVNNFTYKQDIYSVYNSYQLKFTKWTVKAGARFERTTNDAVFSKGSTLNQQFNNLVPSISLQRSLKNSSLTFGFTQRIQRPGIFQLNPFVDRSNPNYITQGNPELRPAINNNFELSYGNFAKGSVNISGSYSFANNTIQSLASVNNDVTTTTFANVGKNKTLGLDVNLNYPLSKKLNVNVNAEILRIWLKGTYNGQFYTNSGQQGHVFTNSSYKFDSGYRIGLNIGYDSRYVLLQGTDNWYFGYGTNVSKEFLDKKLTVSLNIQSPFKKFNKLDFYTKTPDFQTYSYNYNYFRSFGINLSYKFGKLNSSIKKNQRGINNDDTSGGGRE
jgi:outer membrane receptor protein involved in Fe transport